MLKWFRPKEENKSEDNDTSTEEQKEPNEISSSYENKKGFFGRLKERLTKTRETLISRVDHLVLGKKEIDEDLLDELEEILITSDLGVLTTQALIDSVQQKVKRKELNDPEKLRETLQQEILRFLEVPQRSLIIPKNLLLFWSSGSMVWEKPRPSESWLKNFGSKGKRFY